MSSSVLYNNVFQAKIGNVQNQADSSAVYSAGVWSFKNSTALTSVTITDAGNVGIGTASPTSYANYRGVSIQGTTGSFIKATSVTNSVGANFSADGSSSTVDIGSDTNHPVVFKTNSAERMRIDTDGRLRVMAASSGGEAAIFTNSIASNPYGLTVNFSGADPNNTTQWVFRAAASATNIYTIWSNGTVTARSDIRYKQDITPARNYLADLNQLEVVNYRWKSNPDGNKELGFIAQQVESIMPGLVLTEKEGDNECKSIKVSVLTPMLVKAIQELSAKNEALEARLAALEAK